MKVIQKVSALLIPPQQRLNVVTGVSFFYIVSILLNVLCPAVHNPSDTIRKKLFALSVKLVMHVFLHLDIICKFMTSDSPFFSHSNRWKVQGLECMEDG
jgi:hypothetical protein